MSKKRYRRAVNCISTSQKKRDEEELSRNSISCSFNCVIAYTQQQQQGTIRHDSSRRLKVSQSEKMGI